MTTMADIAREAGVSVTTVSHVVNKTRAISPETRARVLAVIDRTGFMPNTLARSLAISSTATIGLAVSAVSNFYFAELVAGIDAEVRAAGSTLLLADTHDDAAEEFDVVRSLHQRRVDGILLATATGPTGPALQYLRRMQVPTALVDRCAADDFDQVGVENVESAATLTGHLAANGHRRIGLIAGRPGLQTTLERVSGYRLGLRRHQIRSDPALVVAGNSNADAATEALHQLMERPKPPTALVIGNNFMTIGTLRALGALGLRVPQDIKLACFDDFDWADVFTPALTAIAQPTQLIAHRAVTMVLQRIGGYTGPARTERLAGVFKHRESCGCADRAAHPVASAD